MRISPDAPADGAAVAQWQARVADEQAAVLRARAFAEPLLASETLDTGENTLAHADGVAAVLDLIGGGAELKVSTYLVYACEHLNRPRELITKAFGSDLAAVALETTKLVQLQLSLIHI